VLWKYALFEKKIGKTAAGYKCDWEKLVQNKLVAPNK